MIKGDKMKLVKANDNEFPNCPFCDKKLKEIKAKRFDKFLFKNVRYVYFCPHCKNTLGFAQSVGE